MDSSSLVAAMLSLGLAAPAGVVPATPSVTVVGADTDGNAIKLFDAAGGTPFNFMPYAAGYSGGVRVAVGDVTGDGVPDLITAPGSGVPHVKAFDGVSGALVRSFEAYASSFLGGVYVAAGDVNGDGRADIITGTGPAAGTSGHVKVFDGRTGTEFRSFFAFQGFAGGVSVAAGDVNGDGLADIITGASTSSPGHVRVFDARTGAEVRSFLAYGSTFSGGVFVAGGDINGDGRDDIITGAGPVAGGSPHVKVFSGVDNAELASFFAYTPSFAGGVRVAVGDVNGDGRPDLSTAPGSGMPPTVQRFLSPNLAPGGSFNAFDVSYTGGVFVAGVLKGTRVLRDGFEGD